MTDSVLRTILKAQGRKRPLTLRPIIPTKAQERSLYQHYMRVLDVWREGARDRILPAYAASLSVITTDAAADIAEEIAATESGAVRSIFDFSSWFTGWADQLVLWHVNRIGQQLSYATNIDLTSSLGSANDTVDDFLQRNTALVRNVSDQARGRIADIVFRGLQARTPIRDVGKEINEALGLGRARSLRIASDQTAKLSAALDQQRQLELGFDSFVWRHSDKVRYRPIHKERDGKVFSWTSEVAITDPPGRLPFCGCKALGHMEFD